MRFTKYDLLLFTTLTLKLVIVVFLIPSDDDDAFDQSIYPPTWW